ncbi:hypothetical protein P3342_004608 [Pyrenophora teres f. teres]|nr:hypothetical protein P3342_004608 [Pyrenophora teres f. teres]
MGELLMEGPILARGYLNDVDKTEAAFIDDPAWLLEGYPGHPGRQGRLYKTGDLVQYNADGNLVYLGRKDSQVKVRGQRVELGEVEHHVRECLPEARQLAVEVILPSGQKDHAMLAAFVQLEEGTQNALLDKEAGGEDSMAQVVFLASVEEELAKRLPEHMVPTVFFSLLHFPTTTSGKTDRKRLREIGASFTAQQLAEMRTSSQGPKRQPSTEAEQTMQQLWAQVLSLGADIIGLDDSFFRLGGDSIAAMKLVGEARRMGLQLSVADIFRHPKLADFAGIQITQCSSGTEEVPAYSLLGEDEDVMQVCKDVAAMCSVDASAITDVYPCSPLQEGLMSLTAKRAGDYIMQTVLELRADVNEDAFRAAWELVVQLTAVLRTRIVQHSELGLLQVVVEERIQWTESESLEEYPREDKAVSMGVGDRLARYALIKEPYDGGKRWFVWTMHHALYDGWSLPRILHAVKQAYSGVVLERQPSFNAFIQYLSQQDPEAAAAYWQTALVDCKAALFPTLPPTVTQPVADTTVEYQCPPPSQSATDITTSTLARAAWAIVTSRYTSSDDVVFGATVTGRNAPIAGGEAIVGPTIATVPVRLRVQRDQTVFAFLQGVQQQATDMIAHEQTGLQRIAKMSPGARHACGFQTLLVVQPTDDVLGSDDMLGEWRSYSEMQDFTTYALMVQCVLVKDRVEVTASFDARVIEQWVVEKMLRQFGFVMQQLADAGEEKKVAGIETTTTGDRQQLWAWNQDVPPAIERCVHDQFAEQARARPDTPAICAWDGELTYGELDTLSSKLASHLVQLGVKPEDMVPLCFEKSMWTVVAMLAVLKAGGAFVPLDPDHPASRHEHIFRQTGAQVVLASALYATLWTSLGRSVVIVSEASTSQLPVVTKTADPSVNPGNAAYAIFTSGSTGIPKGVVLEHKAVVTSCLGHGQAFGITDHTRVLQFASYTFDACIAEIITTLLCCGCICVPSDSDRRNNLAKAINAMDVNWALLTPSVARMLDPCVVQSLKILVLGGEQVNSADWDRWPKSIQTINAYGPTECSICCTTYSGKQGFKSGTIGTSIVSVSWVVDPENHNRLAPLGSIGELLVEGPILARGYLNDMEKTEAAFIDDPAWLLEGYGGHSGRQGRLYKTGDLVRYDADGNLVYLGRKDSQVKLRGQRVELGEVEHHVRECLTEAKQLAVEVIVPEGEGGYAMLAAFVQLGDDTYNTLVKEKAGGDSLTVQVVFLDRVEEELAKRVPEHMMLTTFFTLEAMPTTTSGKIDRKRLREIGASFTAQQLAEMRTSSQGPKRQPSTEAERTMQQLWTRVLGIELNGIGLDDSFFRLGGDSIAAMKLVGEARRTGLQLSVADVFRHPRLVDLAYVQNSECSSAAEEVPAFSLLGGRAADTAQVSQDAAAMCSVDASSVEDMYPCSPLQEGLMSLTAKRAGDYIMQSVLELRVDVDEDAFRAAWEHVVQLTAALRTRIVQHSELGLLQVVVEEKIQWTESKRLEEYLREDKAVSMGLGDRLARYALIKEPYDGGKRWFVWTIHHALYDGWSLPRILQAVKQIYSGAVPERQPSFNAFIQYLGQQDLEAATLYWQTALADCKAALFPTLPPTVTQPVADTTVEYQCPPPSQSATDITTSTLVRAAWAIVTSRYTSSDDVVFGATVTGRNAPIAGVEAMVGPTIATVPLRVCLQKDQTVSTLLECLQQQSTDMIAHEQTGLQRIAKMSPGARHACGFQTLLVVQPTDDVLGSDDMLGEWRSYSEMQDFTTYALMVQCTLAKDRVEVTASFDARVIEQWVVEKMLRQFGFVMQQLAEAGAEKTVSDIETTTLEDRQQLWAWNQNVPPAIERCVHDLFTEQAKARPHAPAICAWDGELTYGELDALSSKLAGHLTQLGVKPEDMVPLCFEKSMWTVVAMLAVLKAGGAFVPLDPDHPASRHEDTFRHTGAQVVVTSAQHSARWIGTNHQVVTVSAGSLGQLSTLVNPVGLPAIPENAVYIMFTSGSTGIPKGVVLEHRAVVTSCWGRGRAFGITNLSRVLQFASYTFDACMDEIITTLMYGGCICVPSDSDRRNDLVKAISTMDVSCALLTPSVARLLEPSSVPTLQMLVLQGEQVSFADWNRWPASVQTINGYGPTECSICCNTYSGKQGFKSGIIGTSVASVSWVVDPENHDRLAPLGSIGELLVEGPILARGYLNDIQKTAAVFIDDPAWLLEGYPGHPGRQGRLYKTGDLVRYDANGNLVCLGRKDSQVKLRGQRVELGEVEHHVRECLPEARQLAVEVILPSGQKDHAMLAAFVQLEEGTQNALLDKEASGEDSMAQVVFLASVEEELAKRLPEHMVPTVFFSLLHFPTTTSGKTDRKRLREIGASFTAQQIANMQTSSQDPKRQPSTEAEQTMQKLWAQVLGIELNGIGLDDSFFRLGGDSIAAMKLVGEARRIGLQLSVADIFRYARLVDLASLDTSQCNSAIGEVPAFSLLGGRAADTAQVSQDAAAMCSVDASSVEDMYPCSPLQEGLMSLTAKRAGDYIMQSVLELRVDVDEDAFRAAWEHVVQLTAALRTRIVQHSELGLLQAVVEEKIQWTESTLELEEYLKEDKAVSMGLGDPLARYAIIKEAWGGKRWFVWTIHHALYDGWSLPRVLQAVKQAYNGAVLETQPSFNAFIQYLSQQDLEATAAYWQTALADCEATLFPPLPSSVKQLVADTTVEHQCPLPSRSTSDTTTSTLIRAAWAIVASRYTSSDDVVFGTTITGRNAPVTSIDAIVGPTIATVPLRVRLQKDQTVSSFLGYLQQQATEMIAYEQTGLQQIAKMGPDPQHACGFQTLLVVQPAGDVLGSDDTLGKWRGYSGLQDFMTYALGVRCTLSAEGVKITASFDARVIEHWVVEKMLGQFSFAMQQLAEASADRKVADIDITTTTDRQQLWAWNAELPLAVDRCVHDLFTEQALARPNAPAVCAWDGELTYGELEALSTKLAGHLVQLGVKPEDVVPLCFEKSMWTVVAMLAVLKAGGAFVPLDPDHPASRHEDILRQTGAQVILASAQNTTLFQSSNQTVVTVNRSSYILFPDENREAYPFVRPSNAALAPLGSIGELLVEGPILARGYLNDADKTAAAFVNDPAWLVEGHGKHPGRRGRLYKTGDLVYYNKDGNLVYIGRKDGQVKVRGQRVELGEIENRLRECMPRATQMAVEVISPAGAAEQAKTMVVAFLQLNDEARDALLGGNVPNDDNLSAQVVFPAKVDEKLSNLLPSYMMPEVYFAVPQLPMMISGKTDRKRLREIGASFTAQQLAEMRTSSQGPKRQPSTEAERTMQQLWARMLKVKADSIGLDDSFFRLGGDSIVAMKLVGEARRTGLQLSVADVFRHPRLVDLAYVQNSQCSSAAEEVPAFSLLGEDVNPVQLSQDAAAMCSVAASIVKDIYPCSPLQEGLISLTAKRAGDYIMQSVLELRADVDEDVFCAAWEHVVQSTAALRTRIVQHSELGLLQVVVEEKIQWTESEALEEYLKEDKAVSMGLGDPLAHYALVKEAWGGKRWFVWTIHHALYDGGSLPLILHAVKQVYSGAVLERQPSFNAFIQYLGQQDLEATAAYWQTALSDCEAVLFPPLPSTVTQPVADTTVEYQCPPLSKATLDTTTSTLIRAAWAIVTSCYTSSDDVVYGTTVTGRNAPIAGVEAMVGPTIATVPVRLRVQRDQTVFAFLQGLQQQSTDMIAHEQTGLQHIAKLGSGPRHACGFQTLLVVQPVDDVLGSDDMLGEWRSYSKMQDFTTYALMVQFTLAAEGVQITASFDARVIEHWVLEKMLRQFSFIMQQLAEASEDSKVADIDTTTPEDRQQLWAWNADVPPAIERCVHDLFAEQARARPGAPAICAWDGELTYGELDVLSSNLAGHLVQLGVNPEDVVPLCFEKSMWTVVAMLAVLKAGGAFVPLDPDHPASRHEEIFEQTGAQVVVASAQYSARWTSSSCHVVTVSKALSSQLPAVVDSTNTSVRPENAAYIIFTSGSTGVPKGVVLEHRAVATSCLGHGRAFGITNLSRVLQFASYTFDACIAEIITTLLCGGCICVPSDSDRRNSLAKAISTMDVNWAFLTPSVARLLDPGLIPSLKILAIGGEQSSSADWNRWPGSVQKIHVWANRMLHFALDILPSKALSLALSERRSLPINGRAADGRPILARGYLNDVDKTEAAFIDDPAWLLEGYPGHPGRQGRLYKTGDLVQYNADGNLVYLGRKDSQVKVRGQRVELGEIEHHVRECLPEARQLAVEVILPSGQKNHAMLAVFVQLGKGTHIAHLEEKAGGEDSMAQVVFLTGTEEELAKRLPKHMVPTVFFALLHFPMTTSGKADRKRLREIGASFTAQQLAETQTSSQGPKRQPLTEAEQTMQQLWARVLGIDADIIGLDDSFFRLGGDSIAAMKLVGEARRTGLQLSVADIFRHPRLIDLASLKSTFCNSVVEEVPAFSLLSPVMKDAMFSVTEPFGPSLRIDDITDVVPASYIQQFYIATGVRAPREAFNYPFIDLSDAVDIQVLQASCSALLEHFPILRTHFVYFQGKLYQVIPRHQDLPFSIFEVNGALAEESQAIHIRDLDQTSPLGLPTSFTLVRNASGMNRLIIRLSHAQYDGVCMPVIWASLASIYQQEPLLSTTGFHSYLAYVHNQRSASINYWSRLLKGSHITNITSKLRPKLGKDTTIRSVKVERVIRTPQLPTGLTMASLVSSAWAVVLSHISGEEDVVYGLVVAGRNSDLPSITEVVGPCLNFVPVRARPYSTRTSEELLQSVQDQYISLGESDSIGLDDIVQHCTDWPAKSEFDSIIQHQNIEEQPEIQFAGETTKLQWFKNSFAVSRQLFVFSHPRGNSLTITITGNTGILTDQCAEKLLVMLCDTISQLSDSLDTPLAACKLLLPTCT